MALFDTAKLSCVSGCYPGRFRSSDRREIVSLCFVAALHCFLVFTSRLHGFLFSGIVAGSSLSGNVLFLPSDLPYLCSA